MENSRGKKRQFEYKPDSVPPSKKIKLIHDPNSNLFEINSTRVVCTPDKVSPTGEITKLKQMITKLEKRITNLEKNNSDMAIDDFFNTDTEANHSPRWASYIG